MKGLIIFSAALLGCLVLSSMLLDSAAGGDKGPPQKDDKEPAVREISIHADAWQMRIFKDGSGSVGYGASAGDHYFFKVGSIDFAAALKDLRAATNPKGNIGDSYGVGFLEEGKSSTTSLYTRDAKLVLGLFEKAIQAEPRTARNPRVEALWKERPPADFSKK
jgi:hypothetical protein